MTEIWDDETMLLTEVVLLTRNRTFGRRDSYD